MDIEWLVLIISLPGRSPAPRMRIWRALKASGAGILRDGVYILPQSLVHAELFDKQAQEVLALEGSAYVLRHNTHENTDETTQYKTLFDRSTQYRDWDVHATEFKARLRDMDHARARREEAQLRRELESICRIDFFYGADNTAAKKVLNEVSNTLNRHFSPDEPTAGDRKIEVLVGSRFRNRIWATRADLWVDRIASAWLIKRYIDPKAQFLWLQKPENCPEDALGFDFDGATFSHVDQLVTFEVLVKSFDLGSDAALVTIGSLVHFLDVGGSSIEEAPGFLVLLAGAKSQSDDDNEFVVRGFELLDNLYAAYNAPD